MNEEKFLSMVRDAIGTPQELSKAMLLAEIDEYDSLAFLGLIGLYENLSVKVTTEQIKSAQTVADLVALAGEHLNG